jgi:hypothetical protein
VHLSALGLRAVQLWGGDDELKTELVQSNRGN